MAPTALQISHSHWVDDDPVCVVLVGVTDTGRSSALVVRDASIRPYFYVILPDGIEQKFQDFGSVGKRLKEFVESSIKWRFRDLSVEHARARKTPADHYRSEKAHVVRLTFPSRAAMDAARKLLWKPFGGRVSISADLLATLTGRSVAEAAAAISSNRTEGWHVRTAEAAVDPASRFLVNRGLSPEDWIEWNGKPVKSKLTTCVNERDALTSKIKKLDRIGDAQKKIVSVCIDAHGAAVVDAATGDVLLSIESTGNMFSAITDCIKNADPDVLVTFGGRRADWRLLDDACKSSGVKPFDGWSRIVGCDASIREDTADNARVTFTCPGRIEFDVQAWLQRNQSIKLRCYDLESVVPEFLGRPPAAGCAGRAKDVVDLLSMPSKGNKTFQALVKELHYANASGAPSSDICAGCGTQRTLRQKLLRVAHSRPEGFIFPDTPSGAKDADAPDESEDAGVGFKGGKVLEAVADLYRTDRPVCVFDFGSLYPSIMRERNLCVTSRTDLASALASGVEIAEKPPCPWPEGTWLGPPGLRIVDKAPENADGTYTVYGRKATLLDDGHSMRFEDDGETWARDPASVMVCVSKVTLEGMLPGMLAGLKKERTLCKNAGAVAKKEGRHAEAVFRDLQQNAIKVLMNGAYGGLGARQGGVFNDASDIAAAVTACGRRLITGVSRTVESVVWLDVAGDAGGIDGVHERPAVFTRPKTVYGGANLDTDSVFIMMEGLSLAAANALGNEIAKWYADRLPDPHVLEFEKVMSPLLMMKAKMYAGIKYEGKIGPDDGRLMVRGIAAVRRDNFKAAVAAQQQLLDYVMKCPSVDQIKECAAAIRRKVRSSIEHVHDAMPPPDLFGLGEFVQTGSLSKPMVGPNAYTQKDVVTPALAVARADKLRVYGLGSRVPWVLCTGAGGVAERAASPEALRAERLPLDFEHYMSRVDSVLAMLLAPIMASGGVHLNATMAGPSRALRVESKKGDRDKVDGLSDALRFLGSVGGSSCTRLEVLSPPDDPVQKKVIRCGIHVVTVVGDGSGRAWATGTNLGKLRWPAARWESHGAVVRGRAHAEATGSWAERLLEASECTQDDKVSATKRLAEPERKTLKKAKVDAKQKTLNGFFKH